MSLRYAWILVAGACVAPASDIPITSSNALEITFLQIERFDRDGNDVVALRGLTTDGRERATIELVQGTIDNLPRRGERAHGSELAVTIDGTRRTLRTRETKLFRIAATDVTDDPAGIELLRQPDVSSRLQSELNLVIDADIGRSEDRPYAVSCPESYLLTSPIAGMCCYGPVWGWSGGDRTIFSPDLNQGLTIRLHNPYGTGCTASDGVSSCSGTECYYGPNGFARAFVQGPIANYYVFIREWSGQCTYGWTSFPDNSDWYSVWGSFPRDQGCPGGAGGGSPDWDY